MSFSTGIQPDATNAPVTNDLNSGNKVMNKQLTEVVPPPSHINMPPRNPLNHPVAVINRIRSTPFFDDGRPRPVFVAGPMVRYSKLPFREVCRLHNVDIVYTPMILAREFVRHPFARATDFSTNATDTPVVAQFGANNPLDLVRAVDLIRPYVDGIGLNCGCPIKDQVREGIGAALMTKPDLVAEMVKAVKKAHGPGFCVEVKIRIHKDLDETVEFAKKAEAAGADFITVHGRLKTQRSSQPANFDAIRLIKNSVNVPVISNGDAFCVEDAFRISEYTGCDGVMAARGVLANPAMFDLQSWKRRTTWESRHPKSKRRPRRRFSLSEQPLYAAKQNDYEDMVIDKQPVTESDIFKYTHWSTIEIFWDLVTAYGLPFRVAQHHFSQMLDGGITKRQKKSMNDAANLVELLQWFDERFDLKRPSEPGFGAHREYPWKKEWVEKELQDAVLRAQEEAEEKDESEWEEKKKALEENLKNLKMD